MVFESHLFLLENTAPMVYVSNTEPKIIAGNLQAHQKAQVLCGNAMSRKGLQGQNGNSYHS